jgi:hypothetical protein
MSCPELVERSDLGIQWKEGVVCESQDVQPCWGYAIYPMDAKTPPVLPSIHTEPKRGIIMGSRSLIFNVMKF